MFITFEGIDKSGKSTQAKMLAEYLKQKGREVLLTKEPYDEETRRRLLFKNSLLPVEEFELFLSDRQKHLNELILPALRKGIVVISDRYMDSSTAYQGYGLFVPVDYIEKRQSNLYIPDITFIMDIDPKITFQRMNAGDDIEKRGIHYLERVRKGYLYIAEKNPERCIVMDATLSVQKLHDQIVSTVERQMDKEIII
jgi:dTMP kinase